MRILICDDNKNILDQLQKYIMEFFKSRKLKSLKYAAITVVKPYFLMPALKILFFWI